MLDEKIKIDGVKVAEPQLVKNSQNQKGASSCHSFIIESLKWIQVVDSSGSSSLTLNSNQSLINQSIQVILQTDIMNKIAKERPKVFLPVQIQQKCEETRNRQKSQFKSPEELKILECKHALSSLQKAGPLFSQSISMSMGSFPDVFPELNRKIQDMQCLDINTKSNLLYSQDCLNWENVNIKQYNQVTEVVDDETDINLINSSTQKRSLNNLGNSGLHFYF